ncbi:MAG TPA: methyltransferase domain-containing protein [Solirubrobacteraceae bacterium]|nr:methyltransferase domain-containing protein [Solirubrobacteraceae bacterium]
MTIRDEARRGFQAGAAAYERGRPGYPAGAIEWLRNELGLRPGRTVADLGAGTGKLTRELVASGASVVAVEPVPGMRAVLERVVPAARVLDGTAEAMPVPDESVDAITVAQAFHWFDVPRTLAEFHRVLRPGGRFAVIWNRRLREQPLHQAIHEITEPYRGDSPSHYDSGWRESIAADGRFAAAGETKVPFEQQFDADSLVDRVGSISFIAALDDQERERVLGRVRALALAAGQPLRLGYSTEVYAYERG